MCLSTLTVDPRVMEITVESKIKRQSMFCISKPSCPELLRGWVCHSTKMATGASSTPQVFATISTIERDFYPLPLSKESTPTMRLLHSVPTLEVAQTWRVPYQAVRLYTGLFCWVKAPNGALSHISDSVCQQ